jgi:hypothetical protein
MLNYYFVLHEDIWGSGGIAPPFLTLALDGGESSASHACCLLFNPPQGKNPSVPTEQDNRWAPELVWMLWRIEKSCAAWN